MAHELAETAGRKAIAFVGDRPWHGLGQELTKDASIETWIKESGLGYMIKAAPIRFEVPEIDSSVLKSIGVSSGRTELKTFKDRVALYREDTNQELSIVSSKYNIVQPSEVLEFFRSLVERADSKMYLETAGALFGGTRYWAMANTGIEADVTKNDRIRCRLLLVSSCDGTLATTAKYIAERVVCNNTLGMALMESSNKPVVRVTHGGQFNPEKIKETLELAEAGWSDFITKIQTMAKKKLSKLEAQDFIARIMLDAKQYDVWSNGDELHGRVEAKLQHLFHMYNGNAMGADLAGNTLWGALNVITEFADHQIGDKVDNQLWNSWFGYTHNLKSTAFEKALELV